MEYVPGKDNEAADALSRWAYPACEAFADVSIFGSKVDEEEMLAEIVNEREQKKTCVYGVRCAPMGQVLHRDGAGKALVKLLNKDAKVPTRATAWAAGYDIHSTHDLVIPPLEKDWCLRVWQ